MLQMLFVSFENMKTTLHNSLPFSMRIHHAQEKEICFEKSRHILLKNTVTPVHTVNHWKKVGSTPYQSSDLQIAKTMNMDDGAH